MTKENNKEFEYSGSLINGFLILAVDIILLPACTVWLAVLLSNALESYSPIAPYVIGIIICTLAIVVISCGFFVQQPNQARVMIFFGKYRGTCHKVGFFWVNPFMSKRKISLRIHNMNVSPIKVNDKVGNPVMIGMVLVWKVRDTYRAVFDVDAEAAQISIINAKGQPELETESSSKATAKALDNFVNIQSDAALREVTGHYAYDDEGNTPDNEITLRGGSHEIVEQLEEKLNDRLSMAGIEVVEARINYLAYAPEIAAVMLRRQQASAIITAREKIVEGAVSMVKMALDQLKAEDVVELDEERKATMVSNLLVVLCADEPAQPVLNTGTLYN